MSASKRPMARTWDGQPISEEPPYGVAVLVYCHTPHGCRFLLLHRARRHPDDEGDWAWTPPSGARYPGETEAACALRELREETGLELLPRRTAHGSADWWPYAAEAAPGAAVRLSAEHDRHEWVDMEEAVRRCKPEGVAAPFLKLGAELGLFAE